MIPNQTHEPRTPDAVILVPGIAGSELVDPDTGDLVWGLRPKLLERVLLSGSIFDRLLDDRLEVGEILRVRCFLPGLGRFDPYTKLADTLRDRVCADPAAFAAYPYDWRRPLHETGSSLAAFAACHLEQWRRHPRGSANARICFVAHSMGGLLARYAANANDGLDRDTVSLISTLGTPFGGSVKAVRGIGHGDILPIPGRAEQVRTLLRATPAVYDLLPSYPALTTDPARPGATRPTTADFVTVGADKELAELAATTRQRLDTEIAAWPEPPVASLMGSAQPAHQSFTIDAGEMAFHRQVDGKDWAGDGTVYTGSAYVNGHRPAHALPQKHGPIARSPEGVEWVRATIEHRTLGPPQGGGIGLDVPEAALAGQPIPIRVVTERLGGVTITITDITGRPLPRPRLRPSGTPGQLNAEVTLNQPGLYEITAQGGGYSAVATDTLVHPVPGP